MEMCEELQGEDLEGFKLEDEIQESFSKMSESLEKKVEEHWELFKDFGYLLVSTKPQIEIFHGLLKRFHGTKNKDLKDFKMEDFFKVLEEDHEMLKLFIEEHII